MLLVDVVPKICKLPMTMWALGGRALGSWVLLRLVVVDVVVVVIVRVHHHSHWLNVHIQRINTNGLKTHLCKNKNILKRRIQLGKGLMDLSILIDDDLILKRYSNVDLLNLMRMTNNSSDKIQKKISPFQIQPILTNFYL